MRSSCTLCIPSCVRLWQLSLPPLRDSHLAPVEPLPEIANFLSQGHDFLELGADIPLRCQADPTMDGSRALVSATLGINKLLTKYETVPMLLQAVRDALVNLQGEAADHLRGLSLQVIDARIKALKPVVRIPPFIEEASVHWMDDYDGDINDLVEFHAFLVKTFFTYDPRSFQKVFDSATQAMSAAEAVFAVFGRPESKNLDAAAEIMLQAQVNDFEGMICGRIDEFRGASVRLKREFTALYDNTPNDVWTATHTSLQIIVEARVPPSKKKPKLE